MKKAILVSLILFTFFSYAEECDLSNLAKELGDKVKLLHKEKEFNENSHTLSKIIKNSGLEKTSYMTKWKAASEAQAGKWPRQGNTLVIGVPDAKISKWKNTIAKKSFGIGFLDLPQDTADGGSPYAMLRVGQKIYPFDAIQSNDASRLRNRLGSIDDYIFTEATFMASRDELSAIEKFIKNRVKGKIKARENLRSFKKPRSGRVYDMDKGDVINPEYNHYGDNLYFESCANACASWFSPRWLEHYTAPTGLLLVDMAKKNGLVPNKNSKYPIYSNFRNPNMSAISMVGIDGFDEADLVRKFLEEHSWGRTHGMMAGNNIPDAPNGKTSSSYSSHRYTIEQWIRENE